MGQEARGEAEVQARRTESDTPRTDAVILGGTIGQNALLAHAQQLERENAKLREALNRLLYGTDCELDNEGRSVFAFTTAKLAQARAALSA